MFDWTAIDFETTGSVPGWSDQPWQIGLADFSGGNISGTWDRWLGVASDRPFNAYAPGRHAQLREQLAREPGLPGCWPEWRERVQGRVLVAHNAATEQRVLRDAVPMERFGPWIDTLKLARAAWPGMSGYGLEQLVDRFELGPAVEAACPGRAAHDALYDAVACGLLLAHLLQQPGWAGMSVEALQRCG